ncbi:thermonuclease family protein [Azospirillum rugosum]|uniref:Endonuclease YncB(Thermonuclease family) n=1 Tax=Azospirillum rugosum TaxID=416170 RepID=A0ABS4SVT1_9PROT|nr:thermonuclease family protein [Azospirillum rugosum]MBP2296673.1 endonuclease YncB(thermonuclease family) [Azospirillum rugosum]MDQ0530268.1 endonuclease YncB(thermonuclease family) [Azospirillum rugosum]
MTRSLPSVLLALLLMTLAPAEAAAQRLRAAGVIDGDTLELEDGRRLRLAGIEAAKPPPNAAPGTRWPLAEAATTALAELALGRNLSPRGEARTDRHGRLVAQLQRDDGLWLQGALLARGLARVHTQPANQPDGRALAREMLAAEDAARAAGLGIWRTRAYGVRPADDPDMVARDRDSFQILEGRVLRVTKAGSEAYLDFGEDWRTDVTVHIGRVAFRAFTQAGIDPLSYEGRRVRVRGWVGLRSGPMIEATHPEQIERLDDSRTPAPKVSIAPPAEPPPSVSDPDDEDAD